MPLKELLAAKAGPIVMTAVQSYLSRVPGASNAQVKQMILENFSNVGTRTEAFHHLKKMVLEDDESLMAHNAEYAAIHEAAYGITPDNQINQITFLDYAKTLTQFTSKLLTKQITQDDTQIHTLRQTMDTAESLDRQARQQEITKQERNTLRETTIREESVNKLSLPDEVNFMSGRNDNRFNSTMKYNNGCRNNSPRGRNSSYHNSRNSSYSDNNRSERNNSYSDSKNWNPRYNYSNNYDSRRRLNRYRHHLEIPRTR